jgi:hypothetical protein
MAPSTTWASSPYLTIQPRSPVALHERALCGPLRPAFKSVVIIPRSHAEWILEPGCHPLNEETEHDQTETTV